MKDIAQLKKESVFVYPSYGRETEEVAVIKESLLKEGKATIDVCWFDCGEYLLLGSTKRLEMAMELELPIILVNYHDYDFVHISKFGFDADRLSTLVDENGNIMVSELFDRCFCATDIYYKTEACVIKGDPVYSLTPKEQFMNMIGTHETGVEVHKAYIELGMNEKTSCDVYMKYLSDKWKAQYAIA